jgi:hypothetical protein
LGCGVLGGAEVTTVHSQPIAVDLFCGLGGWTEGLLAEGYYVVGFDIERHVYGDERYPGQLVLQDVRTIHGRQFRNAALIVGSSPCQEFSYRAMPWKRAKALGPPVLGMELFEAQFRIQREASEAAGRHIPMVVENVRGAQKWVGRSRWNYGSFHLWGDVPALMPTGRVAAKVPGLDWNRFKNGDPNYKGEAFNTILRTREIATGDGIKHHGSGAIWFDTGPASKSSKSKARKRAAATIAKIPITLARHIARVYHPQP